MPAAARLTASVAVGSPHRTSGPGSPIANGAAPPPNASAHVIVASATMTRIAGPAARSARGETPRPASPRGARASREVEAGITLQAYVEPSRGRSGTDLAELRHPAAFAVLQAAVRRNS